MKDGHGPIRQRAAMTQARDDGLIDRIPKIRMLRTVQGLPNILTQDQIRIMVVRNDTSERFRSHRSWPSFSPSTAIPWTTSLGMPKTPTYADPRSAERRPQLSSRRAGEPVVEARCPARASKPWAAHRCSRPYTGRGRRHPTQVHPRIARRVPAPPRRSCSGRKCSLPGTGRRRRR